MKVKIPYLLLTPLISVCVITACSNSSEPQHFAAQDGQSGSESRLEGNLQAESSREIGAIASEESMPQDYFEDMSSYGRSQVGFGSKDNTHIPASGMELKEQKRATEKPKRDIVRTLPVEPQPSVQYLAEPDRQEQALLEVDEVVAGASLSFYDPGLDDRDFADAEFYNAERTSVPVISNREAKKVKSEKFVSSQIGQLERKQKIHHLDRLASAPAPLTKAPPQKEQIRTSLVAAKRNESQKPSIWQSRENSDQLTFIDPTGYWENTYVPGDPQFKYLQYQIAAQQYEAAYSEAVQGVLPYQQPFDSPTATALGIYVNSDVAYADDKQRLLLQVGLKGAAQKGGRRPPMNVAIVVDWNAQMNAIQKQHLKEWLFSLSQLKRLDDHFSLLLVAPHKTLILESEQFKQGPLSVYLDEIDATAAQRTIPAPHYEMISAAHQALIRVQRMGDPGGALGASAVFVVSNEAFNDPQEQLVDLAHQSAVNGIVFSGFSLNETPNQALRNVALLGQGRSRALSDLNAIPELAAEELSSVSRIVARAIRINVQLKPGVKLVSILGSRKLDVENQQRVRDMEQSIDKRVAVHLGLEQDRGKDDPGIQIVIPAFYANDNHVVLLDLVTEGAGGIADVSVKYKDLVFLRNSSNTVSYQLGGRPVAKGYLNINVMKNYLAFNQSESFALAAQAIAQHRPALAHQKLAEIHAYTLALQQMIPRLNLDFELTRDINAVSQYQQLVQYMQSNNGDSDTVIKLSKTLKLAQLKKQHSQLNQY